MAADSSPLRIAVLTSGAALGIDHLLVDPNRGSVYQIPAVISSEEKLSDQQRIEDAGVPVILQPFQRFHRERRLPIRNLRSRSDYDQELIELLQRLEVDYLLLAGYHYILTEAVLAAFPGRIIAVHEGDLTAMDENGRRKYKGLHAVRNAILAGEEQTRCSAFLVTRDIGEGPLFLLSAPYPIAPLARDARLWGAADLLCSYAELHRAWMVRDAWGPMLRRLVELLAAGSVQIIREVVWIDGAPGPCRLGEPPAACHDLESAISPGIPSSCPFFTR